MYVPVRKTYVEGISGMCFAHNKHGASFVQSYLTNAACMFNNIAHGPTNLPLTI